MKNHSLLKNHDTRSHFGRVLWFCSGGSHWGALFFIPWILCSCATVDYLPPQQGTSAELQSLVAKSLEETLKEISFNPGGKKVEVHVKTVGAYETPLGLERYAKSLFQEWVVSRGGSIGQDGFRMDIFIPVMGATATSREMSYQYIPLYYSERYRTIRDVLVVVRNREGRVAYSWRGGQVGDWTDMYLMRIFGSTDDRPADRADDSPSDSAPAMSPFP